MKAFTIDADNNITFHASKTSARAAEELDAQTFTSEAELDRLASSWPGPRLVEIWNSLPGVTAVKKFTSRAVATKRIWAQIQSLQVESAVETPAAPVAEEKKAKTPKVARVPKAKKAGSEATHTTTEAKPIREGSQMATLIALLRRPEGVTLEAAMKATGWLSHTTRAFMSATLPKRIGQKVISEKVNGARTYRLPAVEEAAA